jgi:hypothetical protein
MLLNSYAVEVDCSPKKPSTYDRNFKDDMKTALDLVFKFSEELEKLHPECKRTISKLLQERF